MRISKRMAGLLEKAATCFDQGTSPFHHHDWLSDSEITLTECEQLSKLIGVVLQGFVKSTDKAQTEILLLGQADGGLPAERLRALIEQRDVVKRLESVLLSRG